MCIDCHNSATRLIVAALTIGKGADYVPPASHDEEDRTAIAENMKIAFTDMTRLLELTMFNYVDGKPDEQGASTGGFRVTEENGPALAEFFAMLSSTRLWWMAKLLGQLRAQFDVTEDVAIDAMVVREKQDAHEAIEQFLGALVPGMVAQRHARPERMN